MVFSGLDAAANKDAQTLSLGDFLTKHKDILVKTASVLSPQSGNTKNQVSLQVDSVVQNYVVTLYVNGKASTSQKIPKVVSPVDRTLS